MSQAAELTTEQPTEAHTETTGPSEGGLAASLGLNVQLFAFQLLNFVIVATTIWFLILKPLTKKLEERKRLIDDSLDKAKEVETNFAMSEQKYKEKLDEAKAEANKVIESAHAEGERLSQEMKVKAKEEVEKLVNQAKKNIADEKDNMLASVRAEAADLIVAAMEKVLNEKMNSTKDVKFIEESLKGLK